MNKLQFKKSFLAAMSILLCMVACRKESLESRTYSFVYYYKNYCGGEIRVSVPNSFSPGSQDVSITRWYIVTSGYWTYGTTDSCRRSIPATLQLYDMCKEIKVDVRNAENKLVYSAINDDIRRAWNGNLMNGTTPAPAGQYYWKLRIVDPDDVVHEEQGTVYLVR